MNLFHILMVSMLMFFARTVVVLHAVNVAHGLIVKVINATAYLPYDQQRSHLRAIEAVVQQWKAENMLMQICDLTCWTPRQISPCIDALPKIGG